MFNVCLKTIFGGCWMKFIELWFIIGCRLLMRTCPVLGMLFTVTGWILGNAAWSIWVCGRNNMFGCCIGALALTAFYCGII